MACIDNNPKSLEGKICKIPMETIPEETVLEILARLPLKSIARFKSVCKSWKSAIESAYFRRLFVSLHKNSSSSWSLMFPTNCVHPNTEGISFHGCETWDLPKSLGSYILSFQPYLNLYTSRYFYLGSSNGLILIMVHQSGSSLVGNPVLNQWVEIPRPTKTSCLAIGLVTRVDEDGVVSSFKVVRSCLQSGRELNNMGISEWRVYVYSSETGTWSFKRLVSSHPLLFKISFYHPVSLNGMLYMWGDRLNDTEPGVIVAYDFYGPETDNQCRVIPLPVPYNELVRRCLTTCGGNVIYIEILDRKMNVWRLNNKSSESSEWWQLLGEETNMASAGFDVDCIPMTMNPFDSHIVYLWSLQHNCFVSGNLQTQEFVLHQESENNESSSESCSRINTHGFQKYMKGNQGNRDITKVLMLSQFVLPRWMDSVPRPPN